MKILKVAAGICSLILLVTGCTAAPTQGLAASPPEATPTPGGTVVPAPGELSVSDSGKTYTLTITSRVSIILNQSDYPEANISVICDPVGAIGVISNLPGVPPGFYAVRYEGVMPGTCTISNGSFEVTIIVLELPS